MGSPRRTHSGESRPSKPEPLCSIERTAQLMGDRWTVLILREVLLYRLERFADIERILRIAPNILTDRLTSLVDAGLLRKVEYREAGSRARFAYQPTPAGEDLKLVLAAMQQWGDEHIPPAAGVTIARETASGHRPVHLGFVDAAGAEHPLDDIAFVPTAAYEPREGSQTAGATRQD
ncbi:winged helix-turn-helix transcriptional regulator [Plantibacter sp. Mn2098]|uniref:winged helix-turn-helix transcriptional regulator n=1 Tax=Plantibacter sp. Mn2098 TaxID=3395266 RepID=UPI003BD52E16